MADIARAAYFATKTQSVFAKSSATPLRQANSANAIAGFTSLLTRSVDMGETFTSQELEQFFAIASEANELGVRARNEIEDLRIRQEQLSGYAYSEADAILIP